MCPSNKPIMLDHELAVRELKRRTSCVWHLHRFTGAVTVKTRRSVLVTPWCHSCPGLLSFFLFLGLHPVLSDFVQDLPTGTCNFSDLMRSGTCSKHWYCLLWDGMSPFNHTHTSAGYVRKSEYRLHRFDSTRVQSPLPPNYMTLFQIVFPNNQDVCPLNHCIYFVVVVDTVPDSKALTAPGGTVLQTVHWTSPGFRGRAGYSVITSLSLLLSVCPTVKYMRVKCTIIYQRVLKCVFGAKPAKRLLEMLLFEAPCTWYSSFTIFVFFMEVFCWWILHQIIPAVLMVKCNLYFFFFPRLRSFLVRSKYSGRDQKHKSTLSKQAA